MPLTDDMRKEYSNLFDTCEIQPAHLAEVDSIATKILANRSRYERVGTPLGIPWYFIGVVHNMESSLDFTKHLHNGDPLTARTFHVPKGRPASGEPPFTWEDSATDALKLEKLDTVRDWSIPRMLFQLEDYNGFGYRNRHPPINSPYLWCFSTNYVKGKFVKDGVFDPDAVSKQCGAAVILRRLAEKGAIQFTSDGLPLTPSEESTASISNFEPLVRYSDSAVSEPARNLQRALNTMPGIFLLVDGIPGRKTSDALRIVTGHFLQGDPRVQAAAAGK